MACDETDWPIYWALDDWDDPHPQLQAYPVDRTLAQWTSGPLQSDDCTQVQAIVAGFASSNASIQPGVPSRYAVP